MQVERNATSSISSKTHLPSSNQVLGFWYARYPHAYTSWAASRALSEAKDLIPTETSFPHHCASAHLRSDACSRVFLYDLASCVILSQKKSPNAGSMQCGPRLGDQDTQHPIDLICKSTKRSAIDPSTRTPCPDYKAGDPIDHGYKAIPLMS